MLLRLEEYRNEGAEEVPLRVEEPFSGEASPAEGQGRAGGDDRHRVVQTHRGGDQRSRLGYVNPLATIAVF